MEKHVLRDLRFGPADGVRWPFPEDQLDVTVGDGRFGYRYTLNEATGQLEYTEEFWPIEEFDFDSFEREYREAVAVRDITKAMIPPLGLEPWTAPR
jgi:hypothetical protein